MKKTRIIIISLIIILCIASVTIAIIFQMTENDYKKAANKEQSTADDIELIKNNFNHFILTSLLYIFILFEILLSMQNIQQILLPWN